MIHSPYPICITILKKRIYIFDFQLYDVVSQTTCTVWNCLGLWHVNTTCIIRTFCFKNVVSIRWIKFKLRKCKQHSVACKNYTRIIFNIKRRQERLTVKRLWSGFHIWTHQKQTHLNKLTSLCRNNLLYRTFWLILYSISNYLLCSFVWLFHTIWKS